MEISENIADENTDYGSGGQSPATSDPIEEDIPRLSSKTSLTQSDSHKVVIEVIDSDAETSKGVSSLQKYEPKYLTIYTKSIRMYAFCRQIFGQTTIDDGILARNVTHRITGWLAAAILQLVSGMPWPE